MKGFLITLVLLIIVGGVVFYLGWVQIQIDDSEYAVLFTKTNGWESEVIAPGDFIWRWQGIFPTVLRRYDFTLEQQNSRISIDETLPGSSLYADYVPDTPDFNWSATIDLQYMLNSDSLPILASEQGLRPAELDSYYSSLETRIAAVVLDTTGAYINSQSAAAFDSEVPHIFSSSELQNRLQNVLLSEFEHLIFQAIVIHDLQMPDFEIYAAARARYLSRVNTETAAMESALGQLSRIELINSAQQQSLQVLAEILDSNPGLLEYLRIVGETGRDPIGLTPLFTSALQEGVVPQGLSIPLSPAAGQ